MENFFDIIISTFFKDILEKFGGADSKYTTLWIYISSLFLTFLIMGIFFILKKENRKIGLILIFTFIIAFLLNEVGIKQIFKRVRPWIYFYSEIAKNTNTPLNSYCPGFLITSYSFPSGHCAITSTGAFSLLFYYIFIDKKQNKTLKLYTIIGFIVLSLVFLSRLALLHHYFTDCLVGTFEGLLIALIVVFITHIILKKKESI